MHQKTPPVTSSCRSLDSWERQASRICPRMSRRRLKRRCRPHTDVALWVKHLGGGGSRLCVRRKVGYGHTSNSKAAFKTQHEQGKVLRLNQRYCGIIKCWSESINLPSPPSSLRAPPQHAAVYFCRLRHSLTFLKQRHGSLSSALTSIAGMSFVEKYFIRRKMLVIKTSFVKSTHEERSQNTIHSLKTT